VGALDSIDKGILRELRKNCRVTYEALSHSFGVSANAIRNRVDRLQEKGVIVQYILRLSPATSNVYPFLALANTSETADSEGFINRVGNHRLVNKVGFDSNGWCVITGTYRSPSDLSDFSEFIRSFDSVYECEVHPLPTELGGRTELTKLQLRVIKALRDDPRNSIAAVANESGLTARRVRSTLDQLVENDIIRLSIRLNPNTGDTIYVTFRIRWDSGETSAEAIRSQLGTEFPAEFFLEGHSATEPLMWVDFLVEKVSDSERIAHAIKSIPSVRVENTILPFPGKCFPDLMDGVIDELLEAAGLL
jgi:DNA-binding Lrp family transcriptional regulator